MDKIHIICLVEVVVVVVFTQVSNIYDSGILTFCSCGEREKTMIVSITGAIGLSLLTVCRTS